VTGLNEQKFFASFFQERPAAERKKSPAAERQKSKVFFFEKKKQKTFTHLGTHL